MKRIVYKRVANKELKLWIYGDEQKSGNEKRTAILWIHGGGWNSGNPGYFGNDYEYFTKLGAVCFGVEYRLISDSDYNVYDSECTQIAYCVEDCIDSIAYTRMHAQDFGVDVKKIVACGDSAGGHLALCLATDIAGKVTESGKANAVIGFNPITDLTGKWANIVARIADNNDPMINERRCERLKALSPLYNIKNTKIPVLIEHGLNDTVVYPDESNNFCESYNKSGSKAEIKLYSETKHAFILPDYTNNHESLNKGLVDMAEFLRKYEFL